MSNTRFVHYDVQEDFSSNYNEFINSIKKYQLGNLIYGKWTSIYLCMLMHSLFIMYLARTNSFSIIRFAEKIKKKNKEYIISYDLRLQEVFEIIDSKEIHIAGFFGSEESLNQLMIEIKNRSMEISRKELLVKFEKMNELLNIRKLYINLKEALKLGTKYDLSVNELIKLRNEFIHFSPKHWSIQYEYLIDLFKDIIHFIIQILKETNDIENKEQYILELQKIAG